MLFHAKTEETCVHEHMKASIAEVVIMFHSYIPFQEGPHLVRRVLLHAGGDVGVGVQREARREVTEYVGQRFHVHAVL